MSLASPSQGQPAPPAAGGRAGHARATTVLELALAWTLVGVPLAWGVWQVFVKSLDLFR